MRFIKRSRYPDGDSFKLNKKQKRLINKRFRMIVSHSTLSKLLDEDSTRVYNILKGHLADDDL